MTHSVLAVVVSAVFALPSGAPAVHLDRIPDAARVRAQLATADSLDLAGKGDAARNVYRSLIEEQRAANQYPSQALWRLSENYFFHDDLTRAAATLDDLATKTEIERRMITS